MQTQCANSFQKKSVQKFAGVMNKTKCEYSRSTFFYDHVRWNITDRRGVDYGNKKSDVRLRKLRTVLKSPFSLCLIPEREKKNIIIIIVMMKN